MMTALHLINDIPYKNPDGTYAMVVEIPAGTVEKWQTDAKTGQLYHEHVNGKPRIIDFISYPMNYGFAPQTLLPKETGGDGDPLDIVLIAPAQDRGTICAVKVIGALKFEERGEQDTKIVGILPNGPFAHFNDLSEMLMQLPGAIEILRLWFEGYKGPGSFLFQGYANHQEAIAFIEAHYQDWKKYIKPTLTKQVG